MSVSGIDCVVFLMWPGWRNELRSNRWHFAKRWAEHFPVILVQPELETGDVDAATCEQEPRLPQTEILSISSIRPSTPVYGRSDVQIEQIARHLEKRGFKAPLLWMYNPFLIGAYSALPAHLRVYHGSENYFHFSNMARSFIMATRDCIEISDLVIACSDGLAESFAEESSPKHLITINNGCDLAEYEVAANPENRPALAAHIEEKYGLPSASRPRAVFAGNINARLDFSLVEELVLAFPRIEFVIAGPVLEETLSETHHAAWERMLALDNVLAPGRIDPDDLPALYATAQFGFIPYTLDEFIVENGFPLKALEMIAAGLQVTSTLMKPLRKVDPPIRVCDDHEAFIEQFGKMVEHEPEDAELEQARSVCELYDYSASFKHMLRELEKLDSREAQTFAAHLDYMISV